MPMTNFFAHGSKDGFADGFKDGKSIPIEIPLANATFTSKVRLNILYTKMNQ